MPNTINLYLDTTAPTGLAISLDGGNTTTSDDLVDITITADETPYQMLIYGDVDALANPNVGTTDATSTWIAFQSPFQVRVATGDGPKTIRVRVRDEVFNETGEVSAFITLDTTRPVVNMTAPDRARISKVDGRNVSNFNFTVDVPFVEYKVCVVGIEGATQEAGTIIPTTAGSTGTSGTGSFSTATTPMPVKITGADLEAVSAGDGTKIIKVFVRDEAGNWSV